jgi:hypothetical protein
MPKPLMALAAISTSTFGAMPHAHIATKWIRQPANQQRLRPWMSASRPIGVPSMPATSWGQNVTLHIPAAKRSSAESSQPQTIVSLGYAALWERDAI